MGEQQRPGGEPTEEPTPRRLRRARDEGDVARSAELTAAAAFLAGCAACVLGAGSLGAAMVTSFRGGVSRALDETASPTAALREALWDVLRTTAPILGASFVAAVVVGGLQAGGVFTWRPLVPRGERLNPLAGLRRMVSGDTLAGTLRALAKLAVVGVVVVLTLAPHVAEVPRLVGVAPARALAFTGRLAALLVLRVAGLYAVLGAVDYLWERRKQRRRLRMTHEEVKREHKESEGDPRHKAERQRLHRELLQHRMIEAVRTADFVIVNPDHLAVALRYDEASMGAPQIVAKGERLVAEQIKEVARQHGVPIYRDVPLARALCRFELGDEIPEALYDAVAEVLRFVQDRR